MPITSVQDAFPQIATSFTHLSPSDLDLNVTFSGKPLTNLSKTANSQAFPSLLPCFSFFNTYNLLAYNNTSYIICLTHWNVSTKRTGMFVYVAVVSV